MNSQDSEQIDINKTSFEEEKTLENYEKFLNELRSNLCKSKYRKVLEDIQNKHGVFNSIKESWKLIEIKIKCQLKIVNRKLSKYENSIPKMRRIEVWLSKVELEIDEWFDEILKDIQNKEQIEVIIQLILDFLYYSAVYSKNEKLICDCVGYLAIGEKIIKVFIDISRDPKTLSLAQKIILFLSSLLIVDLDFEMAKAYQSTALKLAFKELFYRVDVEEGLNIDSFSKYNQHYLNKLFVNIILAFYHRGVCEEKNGNYPKAAEAYKQAKWFTIKMLKNYMPELSQFIHDVEERSINNAKIFLKSKGISLENKNQDKELFNNIEHNKQIKNSNVKENIKNSIFEENKASNQFEFLKNKYSKTINLIENLKFPDFENDIKKGDDKIKDILYTVKTVNNLMSDKFKKIVDKMDNFNIHKFNKETVDLIQRKINDVKAEENYLKNLEKVNCLNRVKSAFFNTSSKISKLSVTNQINKIEPFKFDQSNKIKNPIIISDKALESKTRLSRNENKITLGKYTMNKSKSQMELTKGTKKKEMDKIDKFTYDEFISNTKFQEKLFQLNKLSNKELMFQKKILSLKKHEINSIPNIDIDNIENIHKANLIVKMKNGIKVSNYNEEIKQKKNEEIVLKEKKQVRYKEKLEIKLIKSLDVKALRNLKNFERTKSKEKLKEKIGINNNCENDFLNVIFNNNELMNKIEKDLVFYDYVEKENLKTISPSKYKEKIYKQRKPISKNFLPHKSMEHFLLKHKIHKASKNE